MRHFLLAGALVVAVVGCSSDSNGVDPLTFGFVEGTVELQGEGPLGNQLILLRRTYEERTIATDDQGHYSSEVRAGERWSASFIDNHSYVGASEAVPFRVDEGETATLPPLVAQRAVYEWDLKYLHEDFVIIYAPVDAIVRFVNSDDQPHEAYRFLVGESDGVVAPGEALEMVFTEPVSIHYRCPFDERPWSLEIQTLDTFHPRPPGR